MVENTEEKYKSLLKKVENLTQEKKLDLSSDEDLSIAIMNLISIEEHLFFTAEKTGKDIYFDLLYEVREMRKELLKRIIKDYEGEGYCISKHLLASSMRLIEVGTKERCQGNKKAARDLFDKAYKLYSLFWAINLKLVDLKDIQDAKSKANDCLPCSEKESPKSSNRPVSQPSKPKISLWDKLSKIIQKAVDCCRE